MQQSKIDLMGFWQCELAVMEVYGAKFDVIAESIVLAVADIWSSEGGS